MVVVAVMLDTKLANVASTKRDVITPGGGWVVGGLITQAGLQRKKTAIYQDRWGGEESI